MKKRQGYLYVVFVLLIVFIVSCCKKDYLREAVKWDAILCISVYTDHSDTLLIYCLPEDLEEEYSSYGDEKKMEEFIYRHLRDSLPFSVSKAFYESQLEHSDQIEKDTLMQSIYDEYGVAGLLKNYFKKGGVNNNVYIFCNTQQRLVEKGEIPLPAFGLDQNLGYMCYLLSRHNIYMGFVFWDEILLVVIKSNCSDMKAIKRYDEESKVLPYRRNPYAE